MVSRSYLSPAAIVRYREDSEQAEKDLTAALVSWRDEARRPRGFCQPSAQSGELFRILRDYIDVEAGNFVAALARSGSGIPSPVAQVAFRWHVRRLIRRVRKDIWESELHANRLPDCEMVCIFSEEALSDLRKLTRGMPEEGVLAEFRRAAWGAPLKSIPFFRGRETICSAVSGCGGRHVLAGEREIYEELFSFYMAPDDLRDALGMEPRERGRLVERKLLKRGVSRVEAAEAIPIDLKTLQNIINGVTRHPRESTWKLIVDYFDAPVKSPGFVARYARSQPGTHPFLP